MFAYIFVNMFVNRFELLVDFFQIVFAELAMTAQLAMAVRV